VGDGKGSETGLQWEARFLALPCAGVAAAAAEGEAEGRSPAVPARSSPSRTLVSTRLRSY
jgi:transcriptional regulator of aromatic amino acid metabolism